MDVRGLLTEGFGRITELYSGIVEDLDDTGLHHRPDGTGNPIGWLLWHLARVQDDHVADLAGQPQVWERFQGRFGLPNGTDDIGYGHTSEQVDALRITDAALLGEYHHEVTLATARYLQTVDEAELEREVDQRWDPPVTAGVRLVSIQGDCLQHLGQAAYVKGLLGSRTS
ncbi:MAG TPA: DinB family protein [Nocardioides sp.]|nr:DinB family protein [Nocardioides sp.]